MSRWCCAAVARGVPSLRVRGAPIRRGPRSAPATAPQMARLYNFNFPSSITGTGQTVALIEFGGGYRAEDLDAYFSQLGVPTPKVSAISVDGKTNHPGSWLDTEVVLDIQVLGAIA